MKLSVTIARMGDFHCVPSLLGKSVDRIESNSIEQSS
jgi:hypothetical protein